MVCSICPKIIFWDRCCKAMVVVGLLEVPFQFLTLVQAIGSASAMKLQLFGGNFHAMCQERSKTSGRDACEGALTIVVPFEI